MSASSNGTIPTGLTLYQFTGQDGGGRDLTVECFLESDTAARLYAVENGTETAVHVITGRVVYVRFL